MKTEDERAATSRSRSTPGGSGRTSDVEILSVDESHAVKVELRASRRLIHLVALTHALGRPAMGLEELGQFRPPVEPPKLQKPNRKARRKALSHARKR